MWIICPAPVGLIELVLCTLGVVSGRGLSTRLAIFAERRPLPQPVFLGVRYRRIRSVE
ncbi:hypothetical protein QFZ21_004249 [Microbacterium sp. W4I20]|nr:hypothetical protein [Microbacterium sp. W4I20]